MRPYLIAALLALPVAAFTLDFPDVVDRIDEIDAVWLAANRIEVARQEIETAAFAGDIGFSLTPSASLAADASGLRSATLGANASVSLPVGLNADAESRLETSVRSVATAIEAHGAAREQGYVELYSLYQSAWLAQEELAVLDAEVVVAQTGYEVARARFAEGAITVAQLGVAMEALERAQTARDQGTLAHRLAWLDLAFTIGVDPSEQQQLTPYHEFSSDPPKPPELSAWAMANDRALAAQRAAIADLEARLAERAPVGEMTSAKVQFSFQDHGVSFSYLPGAPTFGASYTTPDVSLYSSTPTTRDAVPLSVSLSATLAASGTRAEELEHDRLALDLERERHALEILSDALDVRIRSVHQQMHRAGDAVALAERALETAEANLQIVRARADAGQAGDAETSGAEAAVGRARHNLIAARIAHEEAMLSVVIAASYFGEHYPTALETEGERE
jgi:outer membrane protein TolC